jgi:hypothetical protein
MGTILVNVDGPTRVQDCVSGYRRGLRIRTDTLQTKVGGSFRSRCNGLLSGPKQQANKLQHVSAAATAKDMAALRDQYVRNIDGNNPDDYWGSFSSCQDPSSQNADHFCGDGMTADEWKAFNRHWHRCGKYYHTSQNSTPAYNKPTTMILLSKKELEDAFLVGNLALQIAGQKTMVDGQRDLKSVLQKLVELSRNDVVIFAAALGVYDRGDLRKVTEDFSVTQGNSSSHKSSDNSWQIARRALLLAFHPDTLARASPGHRLLGCLVIQHLNQMRRK